MKRALLIGINRYKRRPLDGCVNDVGIMRDLLVGKFQFPERDTTLMTDAAATRDGILAALDHLVAETRSGDIVVIHYAGHGSQMYLDPDEVNQNASGMKNTIVPVDTDRDAQVNRDITDDEINAVLERLAGKTANTTLIFDCCHSGTITRDLQGKSRYLEPGSPRAERGASSVRRRSRSPRGPSGWVPLADSYVLIAGCRDKESSYETPAGRPQEPHGALSWFLHEALSEMPDGITFRELFERVAPKVTKLYYGEPQHPQLEGRIDREVFGVGLSEPMRFFSVTRRSGSQITVGAGAAMGVKVGTRWDVHPPDTRSPSAESLCGALTIAGVSAVESAARINSETEAGISERCRVVEGKHSFGGERLAVHVEASRELGDAMTSLTRAVAGSALLRVAPADAPGVVRVRIRSNPDPCWEIEAQAAPPFPSGSLDAIDDVRRNLETIARYRYALSLDNQDAEPALRGAIDFTVHRVGADGRLSAAEPNRDGVIELEDGDQVGFTVTNTYSTPVYVTLLDFSRSGAIGQLHPPRGAKELVEPGVTFGIATDPRRRKIRVQHEPHAIADVETFKLIATTNESDFWFLTQPGVRAASVWRPDTQPAVTRGTTDESEETGPADDWTTVTMRYLVTPGAA
ncbi:MAG TPA: caspase family protein [Gemmatimonadaceae bacterium]|nr:caspase family protein [Gemmatimonadaceae bacterium]